jgi:hypothetical protein
MGRACRAGKHARIRERYLLEARRWTFVVYVGAVTTVFAFGIEPSLLG